MNADYLIRQKEREEKRLKEKEEGKPEKKRRRTTSRKNKTPANTAGKLILFFLCIWFLLCISVRFMYLLSFCRSSSPYSLLFSLFFLLGEAIEKMLQEKKISSKINYEVLKSLNISVNSSNNQQQNTPELSTTTTTTSELNNAESFKKPLVY